MKLLYLCNNDGSEPRINKEIKTLSKSFQIHFVGMKDVEGNCFIESYVEHLVIIKASRRNPLGLLRYFVQVARLLMTNQYKSIHLVNETMLLLCLPLIWSAKSHKVLDLFDSIFLRLNLSREKCGWIKKLLYSSVHQLIVTDQQRKYLLPSLYQEQACIVPNYPMFQPMPSRSTTNAEEVTLLYYGWFGMNRGTDLLLHLLITDHPIRVIMAGWFGDQESEALLHYKQVHYLGILRQDEVLKIASQADYILCVYRPMNENNIYASPNKLYDAIQIGVPVIINREVNIAKWVEDIGIGIILSEYSTKSIASAFSEIMRRKGQFSFSENLRRDYCWERVQDQLLKVHLG